MTGPRLTVFLTLTLGRDAEEIVDWLGRHAEVRRLAGPLGRRASGVLLRRRAGA